jgi:hypothetical protein
LVELTRVRPARLKVANILVNPGTSQHFVVRRALEWIKAHDDEFGPVDINWYTPGSLLPTLLKEFRDDNPELIQATQLFVFPGRLDIQIDSFASVETAEFVKAYERAFTYAFLSANSFDMSTGQVYFHFSSEIELQRAIALKNAKHKFLFLDSSKLVTISEGGVAYGLRDLLRTSHSVTLYTVSSSQPKDEWVKASFEALYHKLMVPVPDDGDDYRGNTKALRLRIVGANDRPTEQDNKRGRLRDTPELS